MATASSLHIDYRAAASTVPGFRARYPMSSTALENHMNKRIGAALIVLATAAMPALAEAKGCVKGAVVGGVAGHPQATMV